MPGFAFPFLPRHLTLAAFLTIGIPSFVLALAPSRRAALPRPAAALARRVRVPAGLATALGSILSFFLVDVVFGGTLEEGRTAATTTLIVLGLCFVLLLERGPGREHIAIQSYMLAMVAGLGALFAGILAITPVREFFEMSMLGGQWFIAMLSVAIGLGLAGAAWQLPYVQRLELAEGEALEPDEGPEPTHRPRTGEFAAVPGGSTRQPDAGELERWHPPASAATEAPPAAGEDAPDDGTEESAPTRTLPADEAPTEHLPSRERH